MSSRYHHLTAADRHTITLMKKRKCSLRKIAEFLEVNASTISRELRRNSGKHGYQAAFAEEQAVERRHICRKPRKLTPDVICLVSQYLRLKWSPEQIAGRLRGTGELSISAQTIYAHIRKDKQEGGNLYKNLRHPGNYRKRGAGKKECIKDRVSIDLRPQEVADRTRLGDWEIDTVYCSTGPEVLLSLVERLSKFTLIRKLPNRQAGFLARIVRNMLRRHKDKSLTITADNGTEFAAHKMIARLTGAQVYFAHPYCSYERGLNENTNGLIRQYIPKSRKGNTISTRVVKSVQDFLNDRPRKSLNYLTPREVFFDVSLLKQ